MIIFEEHFFTIINKILLNENIDINELEKRLDNAFEINLKSREYLNFNSYKSIINFKLDENHEQYKIVNIDFSEEFINKLINKYNEFFEKERDKSIDKIKYNLFGLLYMYIYQNGIFYGFRYYFFERNYDLFLKNKVNKQKNDLKESILFKDNIFIKFSIIILYVLIVIFFWIKFNFYENFTFQKLYMNYTNNIILLLYLNVQIFIFEITSKYIKKFLILINVFNYLLFISFTWYILSFFQNIYIFEKKKEYTDFNKTIYEISNKEIIEKNFFNNKDVRNLLNNFDIVFNHIGNKLEYNFFLIDDNLIIKKTNGYFYKDLKIEEKNILNNNYECFNSKNTQLIIKNNNFYRIKNEEINKNIYDVDNLINCFDSNDNKKEIINNYFYNVVFEKSKKYVEKEKTIYINLLNFYSIYAFFCIIFFIIFFKQKRYKIKDLSKMSN